MSTVGAASPPRARARLRAVLFPALPLARVRALHVLICAFVIVDVLTFSRDVLSHAGNAGFYRPVALARVLHLPAVTAPIAYTLLVLILAGCVAVILGWRPRLSGAVVAIAFWLWMLYSNSYGYVAHDHLALMVAVAVLPTVAAPRRADLAAGAAAAEPALLPRSDAAGWALRCIQIAVVATYFFSVIPKILYSGSLAAWGNSAILTWASIRRGSSLAHWLVVHTPWVFVPAQWAGLALETLSPVVLFLRGRALHIAIAVYMGFHLSTLVLLGIHFLPTVICWAAFLPLERLRWPGRSRG
ncbi:HTTM domain-containing protein [Brachybacterium sp. AOP43-C2-M15]|uniref:HTTM domain-containing protein n=1 Tax=Brachybacterium sp. AOP43-C2-M15 TaxID=3457661 RepID=UPI0040338C19